GRPAAENDGWGWLDAAHPDDREPLAHAFRHMMATRTNVGLDTRLRRADGEYRPTHVRAAPVTDSAGVVREWVGVGTDVTERRSAEQAFRDAERRVRRVLNSLFAFVSVASPDGTLVEINSPPLRAAGIQSHEALGKKLWDCFWWSHSRKTQDQIRQAIERAAAGEPSRYDAEVRIAGGGLLWVDTMVVPMYDEQGAIVSCIASAVNVSDRKRVEQALLASEARLKEFNATLEQRVRERSAEAQQRADQLRALTLELTDSESRERRRLAQILHDEFQQLVSAAKLKAGMVRGKLKDAGQITMVQQLEELLDQAISASRSLVTELSPPLLHDAGLCPALEWLVRRVHRDHGLTVHLTLGENAEPAAEQIRTIFFECARELLFNVHKHAGTSDAWLHLSQEEGLLKLSVTDRGRGFDSTTLYSPKLDGSFGLFSLRERVTMIGGLVKVASTPGEGTSIELLLPTAAAEDPSGDGAWVTAAGPPPEAGAGLAKTRVVVADDHRLFREGLIALLSQEPYLEVVGEAPDGEVAVDLARSLQPDVLIVDVSMPGLNGLQVTSAVRRDVPRTRVIGLSMHEREDMANALREAGAAAYFTKSGPTEALIATLRSFASEPVEASAN
ncbi:MAG TPA: response regulator, partial [Tepidisphaeraceae bacterium]